MRSLKPFFLLITIYSVLLGSCSKDHVESLCFVASTTSTSGEEITYTYASSRLTEISITEGTSYSDQVSFNYDAKGKISSYTVTYNFTGGTPTSYDVTFAYDVSNRLAQIVSPSSKTVYTYNSSGQLAKEEYFWSDGSSVPTYTLGFYSTYDYPSTNTKNYSTMKEYDGSSSLSGTYTYIYDTKKNPEAAIIRSFQERTNNVIQETYVSPGSSAFVKTYNYTYNANGFPLTVSVKNSGITTAYTYTNCN